MMNTILVFCYCYACLLAAAVSGCVANISSKCDGPVFPNHSRHSNSSCCLGLKCVPGERNSDIDRYCAQIGGFTFIFLVSASEWRGEPDVHCARGILVVSMGISSTQRLFAASSLDHYHKQMVRRGNCVSVWQSCLTLSFLTQASNSTELVAQHYNDGGSKTQHILYFCHSSLLSKQIRK